MSVEQAAPYNVEAVREDFPVLDREVHGKPLVYLDNAATSQKPDEVIDAVSDYYREYKANVHRGMHKLSQEASVAYEDAHERVAEFIGADGMEEIIFTGNTTDSINAVAFGCGVNEIGEGDNVVLTQMEHHSSLVPWQQVVQRTGAELRFLECEDGVIREGEIEEKIDEDTAFVSVVHMSNVFGTVTPVAEITERAHKHGACVLVDGAQSAPHIPVDVDEIGCDFFAFSGHKMCGPTGSGVLYGKKAVLQEMEPFRFGGEMIKKVTYQDSNWADLPWKFEAGTPNIAQGIGLAAAVDYLDGIGMENIHKHEKRLGRHAAELLEDDPEVDVYGPDPEFGNRGGVVSFNVADAHAHDTADLLDSEGVAIRSGHHCAQPLMDMMGVPSTARASFYLYNTHEEVERLTEAVEVVKEIFAR
ncbi:MAG: cysteine desulfurase [Halobacteria archaeon]